MTIPACQLEKENTVNKVTITCLEKNVIELMSHSNEHVEENGPEQLRGRSRGGEELNESVVSSDEYVEDNDSPEQLRELSQGEEGMNESVVSFDTVDSSIDSSGLANDGNLHFACTNARSIVEKIGSLITLFDESLLHFAIITETWLTTRLCPPRVLNDLTVGANISFVRRDRGGRGGGVAISYNPTKLRLNCFETSKNVIKGEYVAAVGSTSLTKRKYLY